MGPLHTGAVFLVSKFGRHCQTTAAREVESTSPPERRNSLSTCVRSYPSPTAPWKYRTVGKSPDQTLCLGGAWTLHRVPMGHVTRSASEIALPSGNHQLAEFSNVNRCSFDVDTSYIGPERTSERRLKIALYSAELSTVDDFRLMHVGGNKVANEAPWRWVRTRENSPARLLKVAHSFPKTLRRWTYLGAFARSVVSPFSGSLVGQRARQA